MNFASSKSLLYALIFGRNIPKVLIILALLWNYFVTNKIFKTFLIKRNFIRFYFFINNYIVY